MNTYKLYYITWFETLWSSEFRVEILGLTCWICPPLSANKQNKKLRRQFLTYCLGYDNNFFNL